MSFYVAGWRICLETDARGAEYWRAYRGPWQRGAHRPASLRQLCEAAPVGAWPMRTEDSLMEQLPLWAERRAA